MKIANLTERGIRRPNLWAECQRLEHEVVNLQGYIARLEYERTHDDLCEGLYNRRGFDAAAGDLQARVQDGDTADYWIGVVDLDAFKSVNDAYGHAVGDTAIQAAGHRIAALAGERGFAARFGGDEFVFLTDGTGMDAFAVADRDGALQVAVEPGATVTGEPAGRVTVTMSIGVAAHHPRVPLGELEHAADCAMYEAKRVTGTGSLVVHTSDRGVPVDVRPLRRVRDRRPVREVAA